MTSISEIRRLYFEEGCGLSEIERKSKHDGKTIRKYIRKTDFTYQEEMGDNGKVKKSKLDTYKEIIDGWLVEDKKYRKKQRHTAKRVFDRLREERKDFDCSYRLVAGYVKEKRRELYSNRDGFLPLEHPPGEARVDFGQAQYYEKGSLVDGHYLTLSFPYSNAGFIQMFKGETLECFLQGMKNIFNHIGKVPHKIWFDNASAIMAPLTKNRDRKVREKFLRFCNHYHFQAVFCNPNSGHEKGNVENKVGFKRRDFLVPVPRIDELVSYNEEILKKSDQAMEKEHYKKEETIQQLFQEDKEKSLDLNPIDFPIESIKRIKTDHYGKVRLNDGKHIYSASPQYALRKVWVCQGAYNVRILDETGS